MVNPHAKYNIELKKLADKYLDDCKKLFMQYKKELKNYENSNDTKKDDKRNTGSSDQTK